MILLLLQSNCEAEILQPFGIVNLHCSAVENYCHRHRDRFVLLESLISHPNLSRYKTTKQLLSGRYSLHTMWMGHCDIFCLKYPNSCNFIVIMQQWIVSFDEHSILKQFRCTVRVEAFHSNAIKMTLTVVYYGHG